MIAFLTTGAALCLLGATVLAWAISARRERDEQERYARQTEADTRPTPTPRWDADFDAQPYAFRSGEAVRVVQGQIDTGTSYRAIRDAIRATNAKLLSDLYAVPIGPMLPPPPIRWHRWLTWWVRYARYRLGELIAGRRFDNEED